MFTSPLTVKVYEEVKEKRKEEVDLETGRRRSIVEEVRYEVLDLTGDTRERRGSQRAPLQPLTCQTSEEVSNIPKTSECLQPQPPVKSPLSILKPSSPLLPDISVLCLSSPSAPPAAPETRAGPPRGYLEARRARRDRNAVPLLR